MSSTTPPADDEAISLPLREHGYASNPLAWKDLVQIIQREKNLAKLTRSIDQERLYLRFRRQLQREWRSVYDHILHTKFGYGKELDESTRLWKSSPDLSELTEVKKVLVPNDFPYFLEEGIEHFVLWKTLEDVTEKEIEQAQMDLRENLGNVEDILYWVTPLHLKSLPDIDHVHFLCLRR